MAPHYKDTAIIIHKIKCGPYDNNAYLLECPRTYESIVIDTPADPGSLIEAAGATDVKAILITHNHQDHLLGFEAVTSAINAPVGVGRADAPALPRPADFFLEDGQEVAAGTLILKAISTPGHTAGSTCLMAGNHLFTGDTLFPGGPGRTGTPQDLRQVIDSITDKLFALDDGTFLYPGHGDDGRLKTAKEEYRVFASREHPIDLCGDVLWLES